jgi:hypothetical protein
MSAAYTKGMSKFMFSQTAPGRKGNLSGENRVFSDSSTGITNQLKKTVET